MINLHNQDCLQGLRGLKDNSIDICVTSPVYKDSDGYNSITLSAIFNQIYRVLKDDSLFFLNFGHLAENKFRPFEVCSMAMNRGFKLNDTITWVKKQYRPLQGNKRLNNLSEFIFLLYKGKMPNLDRKAIGVKHKDQSNVKRWGKDWKCRSNVWEIGYETIQNKSQRPHPDLFPLELARTCLKLSGIKSGTVLDPFAGSATVGIAAKEMELDFVGYEINKKYYEIGIKRLDNLVNQV